MKTALALFAAMAVAAAGPAHAHPHILTEYAIIVLVKDGQFVELRLIWTFDDLYSELVRETIDRNKNGKFDLEEINDVARKAIPSLGKYGFYTYLTVGGATTQPKTVEHFDAKLEDNKASYLFTLPLPAGTKEFTIGLYDKEFYIDFYPAKLAFRIEGGKGDCVIGKGAKVKTDGWGTLTPPQITCKLP